jgi:hypothetical protein
MVLPFPMFLKTPFICSVGLLNVFKFNHHPLALCVRVYQPCWLLVLIFWGPDRGAPTPDP